MKVHYINILLFALPLNILDHIKNKLSIIIRHIPTTRLLCECDLYMPNYDNDPQIKELMENYNRQTSDRFKEYDERMQGKRQKCKDRCDKEIQNIILKDKLEKQMAEQLTTLETKIDTDDIPTCICEKSLADKTEKFCHNCGYGLGSVAPSIGLLGGPGIYGWKTAALAAATKDAITKGLAAGEAARIKAGINAVIAELRALGIDQLSSGTLESIIDANTYTKSSLISRFIETEYSRLRCGSRLLSPDPKEPICTFVYQGIVDTSGGNGVSPEDFIKRTVEEAVEVAKVAAAKAAKDAEAAEKAAILETSTKAIETTSYNWYTTIGYSITAILIIVLIMVIIYLILRYRRKKKMKKKLQYIKLLKE
ncbi:hypothetical protein PFBG_02325 [Plasmodium falciparum 7G8]|uniref:Rifin n=1 Tax=Plasmodium falciparum (isolate 7G8) TaxID=57266 RepID=W7F2X5_PLAF8|nr:hypothetical protein PFBG_02325 [Plasmodium falciparum 7G8]